VFGRVIDFARERPGTLLAWVLVAHVLLWTIVPALVSRNLQLDLHEGLALGRECQDGYWKHPPLPWWLVELAYRATGQIDVVYLLGPLASVACLYFVWRLGRDTIGALPALVAVLSLEGLHFLNFSAVKFAHDQLQLPFWALSGWFFYRALTGKKPLDWIAAGTFLALAFWSKYAAFALAATFAYVLFFDRDARGAWRSSGPYLMGAAFLIVLAPNLWWLATHDFLPFQYVDARAAKAAHWWQYFTFPVLWSFSQIFFLVPTLALLAIVYLRHRLTRAEVAPFTRRYLTALALGPFVVVTLAGALTGRLPVAYAAVEIFEPAFNNRVKASRYPGAAVAQVITARWHQRFGTPLRYVGGIPSGAGPGEFSANTVAVLSPDHPHVIVHGLPKLSPWIDRADLDRRGAVFVWERVEDPPAIPAELKALFPRLELQQPLDLPRSGPFSRTEVTLHYAILPPKP
jgi:4-amino-4-deoxy-L-arabinose transferase-like glycosyltransferase